MIVLNENNLFNCIDFIVDYYLFSNFKKEYNI